MWSLRGASPFGRLSIRKLLAFAVALSTACFAYIVMTAPITHAADVTWNGDKILYDNHEYYRDTDAAAGNTMGFPVGTHTYHYTTEPTTRGSTQKTHFIYFDPSVDPTKATTASYVVFDFIPEATFKNPSDQKTITVEPRTADDNKKTSCAIQGIGWIVCPITNFFAGAMDWLFDVLSGFLAVRPAQTTQGNALFRAWAYIRNFANIMFVIAFLVIIFSQVTSLGISNYGIKKILPRLIVAAILVNISYWICAIAIDISNILGYSMQDIFIAMRNNLVGQEGNSWNVSSWQSVTGFVLSGGTVAGAAGVGTYLAIGAAGGSIYALLPILLGVLLSVIIALLVIAARQAIITVLLVISPLAFVAYVLPNTEKYFHKWRELGLTMLIMFPAFSVVFGGSQLAGTLIIQNANSINLMILGMAVQVAPLAITPLLIRLSGSLITRIAGIVNNPKRGLVDRTRNWSQQRGNEHKARVLANPAKRGQFLRRGAKAIDARRRKREGWTKAYQEMADANWANTHDAHDIHKATARAALVKSVGEAEAEAQFEKLKHTDATIQGLDIKARANKLRVDVSKANVEANWEEIRAGDSRNIILPENLSVGALANHAHDALKFAKEQRGTAEKASVESLRKRSAQRIYDKQFTNETLLKNAKLMGEKKTRALERAGGIAGAEGESSALAGAIKEYRSEYEARVLEKEQLIKHFNLSSKQRQDLAMGTTLEVPAKRDGITYVFKKADDYAREAAVEMQLQTGSFNEIQDIIMQSGKRTVTRADGTTYIEEGATSGFATTIASAITKNNLAKKAVFFGAQTIDDVAQGKIYGDSALDMATMRVFATGKITDNQLSGMSRAAIERLFRITEDPAVRNTEYFKSLDADARAKFERNIDLLKYSAWRVVKTDILSQNAEQTAREFLEKKMQEPPASS